MKLQILIPHYHETADVIKPMLDSIAIQQSVPMDEIGVIICHDGDAPQPGTSWENEPLEEHISPDFCFARDIDFVDTQYDILCDYPFQIRQIHIPHSGVSAARNACLDAATADYVMFCDIDDMFYNACGLWIIFREMENGGFDSLVSIFTEESRVPKALLAGEMLSVPSSPIHPRGDDEIVYVNHEMDSTFVHGKVHRRQYLIDNKIRWNEKLTIHEDSFFNILAQNLSQNVKYCQTPFYLWRWRDDSICRHDPKYILRTYRNMIDSNDALVDEFIKRGAQDKAMFYTAVMIFDSYYTMNKPEWIDQENKEYRDETEKRFAMYYKKRKALWNCIPLPDKMQISNGVRTRSVSEGMMMEAVTIDQWLRKIEKLAGGKKK